jgi:hypothetical protein
MDVPQSISPTSSPFNLTGGIYNQLPNIPSSVVPTQNTPWTWLEDEFTEPPRIWLPVISENGDYFPAATRDNFSPFSSVTSTQCSQYHYPTYSGTNLLHEESEQESWSDIEVELFEGLPDVNCLFVRRRDFF